jgi:hypothetical protein
MGAHEATCSVCGCQMPKPESEHPYWTVPGCDCTGAGSGCCGDPYRYCETDKQREEVWKEERVTLGAKGECQIGCSCDACSEINLLKVGDSACFRDADADQHDPEGLVWYVGRVTKVIPDEPGRPCPVNSYVVCCVDGTVRHFLDYERYFPNAACCKEATQGGA